MLRGPGLGASGQRPAGPATIGYTPTEVDLPNGGFAYDVTSREIAFRVERVRYREIQEIECGYG